MQLLVSLTGLAGCAPPFAKETLERVDRSITFQELKRDPDAYKGIWVMLAGVIIETRNMKEGASIEVLQKPMDRRGQPYETDETEGPLPLDRQARWALILRQALVGICIPRHAEGSERNPSSLDNLLGLDSKAHRFEQWTGSDAHIGCQLLRSSAYRPRARDVQELPAQSTPLIVGVNV